MTKKAKKKYLTTAGIIGTGVLIYFVYPLIVNGIQGKFDNRNDDRKKIVHLWNTLQEVGEISDPENKGVDSELIKALQTISGVERNTHPALWEKHVKGTENDFGQFLNKVEVVVKINHRPTYDLVTLREGGEKVVAKADVNESWKASELPVELTSVAHSIAGKNVDSENVPLLPYAMIGKWSLQRNGKVANSDFPAIDLSNPKIQAMLSRLATEKGSKEMANLAAEKRGLLVPTFELDSAFQDCFKYDVGLVEVDTSNAACKVIAQKYLETAKASAELSRRANSACKSDLIKFADSNMNFDPCAVPGTFTANVLCKDSVPAYIRKMTKDPKAKEETHKRFLLENCQEEIKNVPKVHRHLFE
jgi:hypothetical protein